MRLAIVIPVYNEARWLEKAIERLDATPPPLGPEGEPMPRTLILIDDGSSDGSDEIVRSLDGARDDVIGLLHDRNRGKGAAVRTGLSAARDAGADIALIHDADMEYDPADHPEVVRPIVEGRADAVIGSRFLGRTHRVLYFWHYAANRFISLCSNTLTNLNLSDIECCTKAFSRPVLERLDLREPRFGVEPEIVARLARMRLPTSEGQSRPLRIYEVAVSYDGRTYAEGKKIGWRDGFAALRCILRYNLLPLKPSRQGEQDRTTTDG